MKRLDNFIANILKLEKLIQNNDIGNIIDFLSNLNKNQYGIFTYLHNIKRFDLLYIFCSHNNSLDNDFFFLVNNNFPNYTHLMFANKKANNFDFIYNPIFLLYDEKRFKPFRTCFFEKLNAKKTNLYAKKLLDHIVININQIRQYDHDWYAIFKKKTIQKLNKKNLDVLLNIAINESILILSQLKKIPKSSPPIINGKISNEAEMRQSLNHKLDIINVLVRDIHYGRSFLKTKKNYQKLMIDLINHNYNDELLFKNDFMLAIVSNSYLKISDFDKNIFQNPIFFKLRLNALMKIIKEEVIDTELNFLICHILAPFMNFYIKDLDLINTLIKSLSKKKIFKNLSFDSIIILDVLATKTKNSKLQDLLKLNDNYLTISTSFFGKSCK